ncbi:MAG TPA: alkaline phosphatase family protein [Candidatus Tumulicola sp.]|jgi:phospholipase C
MYRLPLLAAALWTLSACSGGGSFVDDSHATPAVTKQAPGRDTTPIEHVILIVQENRTPDNLFQGLAGANISQTGLNSEGETVTLKPVSLAAPFDLGHNRQSFLTDYDDGKMDGFDRNLPAKYSHRPFSYAPASEVQPYLDMAAQYTFADNMFQSQQAGSFPAHQYLVSGTSSALPATTYSAADNPYDESEPQKTAPAGCDAPNYSLVATLSRRTGDTGAGVFPCFDRPALSDLLDSAQLSWRYYQHLYGTGLWHAFDAIQHVRYGPDYANVVSPSQTILTDISTGQLPALSWVMPASEAYSDHPGSRSAKGPSWVAAVVNAVGQSQYWDSTAIFITWDDWGGWYDHVPPKMYDHFELGFRVPLVIVSPYAKAGYVSHRRHEFGSILRFSETVFGLGSLGTTDKRSDDLGDCFNFKKSPRTFVPIQAPPFNPSSDTTSGPDIEDPE